jgi:hypothetical protein
MRAIVTNDFLEEAKPRARWLEARQERIMLATRKVLVVANLLLGRKQNDVEEMMERIIL